MNKLRFLLILIVTALLAGVVVFSACKKDDDNDPVKAGRKAAKDMCDCFKMADPIKVSKCYLNVLKKYNKWLDNEEFIDEIDVAINCEFPAWL